MGHRIMSTEIFPEKPESECNKRLSSDNVPFDAAIKRPKQDFIHSEGPFFSVASNALVYDPCYTDSSFPWFISKTTRDETLDSLPVYPDNYEKASQFSLREVSFFPVYECDVRKAVPLGLNHQADIPDLNTQASIEDDSDKWIRACLLSNPNLDPVSDDTVCDCADIGSVRCIRQHITEARENMKKKLGVEKFTQLGFGDIGEEVASRWDAQDEKLFAEVVRSNPASFSKKFWNILPLAFPDKCKRDFVSYYFNVYILRKRASQNRSDPLYIDSDDDEWEAPDERYEFDDEMEMEKEDEEGEENDEEGGSGLELSIDQPHNGTCQGEDLGLGSDVVEEAEETGEGMEDALPEKTDRSRGLGIGLGLGLDIQDDSCTSFEAQHDRMVWETGFEHAKKDELLPTFNVIEEVFGKESCDK